MFFIFSFLISICVKRISAVAFNENDYETLQEIQTQIGCNSMACPTFELGSFSDCPLQEAGFINLDLKEALECNEQGFIVKLKYLIDHQVSGIFPIAITKLPQLARFSAENVLIRGTLPSNLNSLAKLEYLSVVSTRISGTIPPLPPTLTLLHLQNNLLQGSIPRPLPLRIVVVNLENNRLSGVIPSIPFTIKFFHVANNQLTGTVPQLNIGLERIDVSNNRLTGEIRADFITTGSCIYLSANDENCFTGTCPHICTCESKGCAGITAGSAAGGGGRTTNTRHTVDTIGTFRNTLTKDPQTKAINPDFTTTVFFAAPSDNNDDDNSSIIIIAAVVSVVCCVLCVVAIVVVVVILNMRKSNNSSNYSTPTSNSNQSTNEYSLAPTPHHIYGETPQSDYALAPTPKSLYGGSQSSSKEKYQVNPHSASKF